MTPSADGTAPALNGRLGELRGVVDTVRQIVTGWDALVTDVETLSREHSAKREGLVRLEQQHVELREAFDRLRVEREAVAQQLTELRAANDRLRTEHEATVRGLAEQRAAHEAKVAEQRAAHDKALAEQRTAHDAATAQQRAAHDAAVAEQRAAHDALRTQYDTVARELAEVRQRYESMLHDRQEATAGLETLLRRLKT
jgi:chromosome segregation ATPase